jgi:glycosidase
MRLISRPLRRLLVPGLLTLAATTGALGAPMAATDWRDQVLYFAMIDRFDDGDPANNDQGAGVFDPADPAKYSGGDIAGLTRRLDYIEGLGATGLWITPPVANQWWDGEARFSGYHGYWARDFKAVDEHYGTLADYRALADGLHARGMTLVQDIVVNHMGNFYAHDDWHAGDPAKGWRPTRDSRPAAAPTAWPFSQNDPRDAAQRALGVYHWTPPIRDYSNEHEERTFELAGLDDLATTNPAVRRALRDAYGFWIREVGVDAFRVDTAFYVEPEFFVDFLQADDAEAPGVMRVARDAGKPTFHLFGEGWGLDKAFDDAQMRKIDAYQRLDGGLPAMIQFPLYGGFGDVFARGHATAELGWRIERTLQVHADPWRMPTFVDNHDVDRFLAGGDEAGLKQALLAMLTLPGIPVVYYGTEQGLRGQRDAMFVSGFGSGGRDHFNAESAMYRAVAAMIALRRVHPTLSRGTPRVIASNAAGPGVLAWTMRGDAEAERAGAARDTDTLLVAMNTAGGEHLMALAGLPPHARLLPLFALDGDAPTLQADPEGRLAAPLAARAGAVWRVDMAVSAADATAADVAGTRGSAMGAERSGAHDAHGWLDPLPASRASGDLDVSGRIDCRDDCAAADLRLVVDGDLARAPRLEPDAEGRWRQTLRTDDHLDPNAEHTVQVFDRATGRSSEVRRFHVDRQWTLVILQRDAIGDDAGPERRYRYPTDVSWGESTGLDLRGATLSASGGALAIELEFGELLHGWNAPNGFDHLALSVFVELPGESGGATVMPQQNASLPDGMRWHRRLRVGGWNNALFDSRGASATSEGTPVTPGARLLADRARRVIRLELPASALGRRDSLSGLRVHVTTWDYDGNWRRLEPDGSGHTFGGGDGAEGDALWMDTMTVAVP